MPAVVTYGKLTEPPQFTKLLEVSAANEVSGMNTFNRTRLLAGSAAGALGVINGSEIVLYLDGAIWAGFLTLAAGDAAVEANLTNLSTLVVAAALYNNAGGVVDQMNNAVRTGLGTKTAADALSGIDLRHVLRVDADRITGTNGNAVTVAKAGKGAEAVARIAHVGGNAGLRTGVNVLALLGNAGAVAGNVSNLLNHVAGLKTHDLTDACGNTVATGNTERGVSGLSLGKRLCISVTAGKAASTAVCTGKTIADLGGTGILLNSEENGREGEDHSADNSNDRKDQYGNNDFHILKFSFRSGNAEQVSDNSGEAEECEGNDGCGDESDGKSLYRLGSGAVLDP